MINELMAQHYAENPRPYSVQYTHGDYGTERVLNVFYKGSLIGSCDPFYPEGLPANPKHWRRIVELAAGRIVRQHREQAQRQAGAA